MDWISDPQAWIGFATLTVLEIVLGIDNIVFISILADRLPTAQQSRARLPQLEPGRQRPLRKEAWVPRAMAARLAAAPSARVVVRR